MFKRSRHLFVSYRTLSLSWKTCNRYCSNLGASSPRQSDPNRESLTTPLDVRQFIEQAAKQRVTGWTLPQDFYSSPKIHQYDIEQVWLKSWLFAGFTCQIPNPGDFMLFNIDRESVILIRDKNMSIYGLHNVCRHRGSRLCTREDGHMKGTIVCPYHQWTYSYDGKLTYARDMPEEFDKTANALHQVKVEEVGGLLWINFSEKPMNNFGEARTTIGPEVVPHKFENAKIAFTKSYKIKANWKVIYENNRDCYHCVKGHPEYIRSNYDTSYIYCKTTDGNLERVVDKRSPYVDEIHAVMNEKSKQWQSLGLSTTASADSKFPGSGWYRASRVPLKKGWVVESIDGKPVSTLMGNFTESDMGSMRVHTFPNFWLHASSDHAVATKLIPIDELNTTAQVSWLVHKDAQEGRDYTLDKLLPFWKATSEQDWRLCEDNQTGLMSRWHEPGRLSDSREAGVDKFIHWYLKTLLS